MVRIAGTGSYAPGEAIDNAELQRLADVQFDAARIEEKLGIERRHMARLRGLDESSADFAEAACRQALDAADWDADEVDLLVVATDTPEYVSPATAVVVQGRLQGGERSCRAYDVNAACAGFVTAFDGAAALVASGRAKRALVVGVYGMPAHLRPGDSFGWSIFADGAGAVALEPSSSSSSQSSFDGSCFVTDGTQWDYIGVYAGGTRRPVTAEVLEQGAWGLELLQRLPPDRNVKLWPPLVRKVCDEAGVAVEALDHALFTQINKSVIVEVMGILGLPLERTTTVMDRFGYTGSACLPMALHEAVSTGRVRRGDRLLLVASGAGLSAGAVLVTY